MYNHVYVDENIPSEELFSEDTTSEVRIVNV